MPKQPKPLDPLISLDDLKKVVTGLAHVPKDAISKPDVRRPKQTEKPKKP